MRKLVLLSFVIVASLQFCGAQSLDKMQWFNEPEQWEIKDKSLSMQVTPQSDYWRISHYGFTVDDAPFYYATYGGEFEVKVKITGDYKQRFDQAGLMLRINHENYQFLFVADVEYFIDQSYFDSLTAKMKVVVMANRDCDLQKIGPEVLLIYRPMHVFSVATILNGEKLQQDAYDERWHHDRFRVKGAKILAVDDSAMNLKVVSSLLSHYGITIDTALSGSEAIDKISDRSYDLVFMDHMMPEMDGVECMHRIHELPRFRERKIPIIALTANAIGGAREMLIREGFDDFVAKPIEKSAMERVLRKYLSMFIEKDTGEEQVTCKTEENSGLSGQFKEGRKEFEAAGIDRRLGLSYFDNNEAD